MTKYCVIMQGASGSGKSTIAKVLAKVLDAKIHCTDDLRMVDGVYVFKAEENAQKHQQNQHNAQVSMGVGRNIIIDNTNIKCWEVKPYVLLAKEYGYVVRFVRCDGQYPNHHGVPPERVQQMRDHMELLTVELCLEAKAPWEK